MSLPMMPWTSTTFSGVKTCLEPSMWLWKVTPASRIFLSPESENTWKPPESVRMLPSQLEKRCSPPNWPMTSMPGLR